MLRLVLIWLEKRSGGRLDPLRRLVEAIRLALSAESAYGADWQWSQLPNRTVLEKAMHGYRYQKVSHFGHAPLGLCKKDSIHTQTRVESNEWAGGSQLYKT